MDDLQAGLRVKRGDIGGLEFLIARHQERAFRTAYLVTRHESLSEDVVQDCFIHFFEHARHFDEKRPFEPYFMVSVMHAALNAALREKRIQPMGDEIDESYLESLMDRSLSVEGEIEKHQVRNEVWQVLSLLSPRQRAVIVQRYYLEMSEKEMSEASRSAPGTVKWLLNAARTRLRILLQSERSEE
jgi:RNA polymerase sigma-70 factor (ECF subfamily)